MKRFDLVSIIANDYELLKKRYCGYAYKLVIKNSSESIEDIFHNQLIVLLESFPDHSSDEYKTEFDFILKELKKKPSKSNKQVQTVEYSENYENQPDDETPYNEYEEKLQLLLIHYSPNGKNQKVRKTKAKTGLLGRPKKPKKENASKIIRVAGVVKAKNVKAFS